MRIPRRRAEERRKFTGSDDPFLSVRAIEELKKELERLERGVRPKNIEEVTRTREMGDLSENAAYQEAKWRLRGVNARITEIQEKLKRARVIEPGVHADGRIRIGSTVVVEIGGKQKLFEITGAHETDPARGRISHLSPIGAALIGHCAGDRVKWVIGDREMKCRIIEVK